MFGIGERNKCQNQVSFLCYPHDPVLLLFKILYASPIANIRQIYQHKLMRRKIVKVVKHFVIMMIMSVLVLYHWSVTMVTVNFVEM